MATEAPAAMRPGAACHPLDERVRRRTASLHSIFNPDSVAIVADAAAPDPAAPAILSTLSKSGFGGRLFAIGLEETASALRVPSYATVKAIPAEVDLAVITAPAEGLPDALRQCAAAGVKGAIITLPCRGDEGPRSELQAAIREILQGSRMRVLGPNCSLLMNPALGLNVSCAAPLPVGGTVAFISQSGALCHAVLDWSFRGVVGFSAFVSIGGMIDVDWGDLIDHFGADRNTRSIVVFMESIGNARSFLSAAREVALNKPIIVVKAGRSEAAARTIAAHTDSPAGSDEVLDAAFRRVGVLRVNTIAELFSMADVLSKEPPPRGPRLGIVSNAAGLTALAADSISDAGAEIPPLSEQSCDELSRLLSARWRAQNPVHVPAGADPKTYAEAARIVLRDANCDGLLLLTSPEGMPHPEKPAELLLGIDHARKPVLACVMGAGDAQAPETLARACVPTFSNPHLAARAFGYMWHYAYNLRALYETPMRRGDPVGSFTRDMAARILAAARAGGQTALSESECRYLLGAYGIHIVETRTATGEDEAARAAAELGFPVTLEMAGAATSTPFRLGLADQESVRRAWRFLAGRATASAAGVNVHPYIAGNDCALRVASWVDPQFGPVLLFGAGGRFADALHDRALGLPPLNATLAERMAERTRVFRALKSGANGKSDVAWLLTLIVRFSQLVVEQPWIKEVDINPLLLTPNGCVGLTARVAVHPASVAEHELPRPAIRSYPLQYASPWQTKRGDILAIRPIQAEDEPLLIKFHERLSDHSVYLRYFQNIALSQRTQHDRLTRICFIDYDREMALVAEQRDPQTDERRIVGLGNLARVRGRNEGEVAVVVSDDYQGHGLGTELMRRLVEIACAEKMDRVIGTTMLENKPTIALLKRVGFQVKANLEDRVVEGEINF